MDILMVSAETGDGPGHTPAGPAVASLSKALKHLGHNVTLVCPKLPGLEESGVLLARRLTPLTLADGSEVTLLDAQMPSGVQLTTFDAPVLFEREGVYGQDGKDYPDNAKRFGLLGQVAAALGRQRIHQGQALDIVHAHDAATGLVPHLVEGFKDRPVPCVFTVHDYTRQGVLPVKDAADLGLGKSDDLDELLRLGGKLNLLKMGLVTASAVTAMSPSYAEQMADPESAGAIAEVVLRLDPPPVGVLGGIDYAIFNPATDASLVNRFDAEDPLNKGRCKTATLRELELELDAERPLFAFAGSLSKESGFDQLISALPKLMKYDISLVIAAPEQGAKTKRLESLVERHRDRLVWVRRNDSATLRRLLAAADFSLNLDRHVPFPAPHMIAQRYGAIVVSRASGGVGDVVVDCDAETKTGSGYLFDGDEAGALVAAVARAITGYRSPRFGELRRLAMRRDSSWDRPARRTLQIYRQALAAVG